MTKYTDTQIVERMEKIAKSDFSIAPPIQHSELEDDKLWYLFGESEKDDITAPTFRELIGKLLDKEAKKV